MPHRFPDPAHAAPDLLEALEPEEREALFRALAEEPGAAEALAHWAALRRHLGEQLRQALPEPELLVLYALGEAEPQALTPEEAERLLEAGPELEAAFKHHPALLDVLGRVRADRDAFEHAWQEEEAAERRPERRDRAPRRGARARWVWRSSVALAVVAFAALLIFLARRDAGFHTYETDAGETREVVLADGSTATLGPRSRLMAEARGEGRRLVRLRGEALFEIRPGTDPFVVETPNAFTKVLGTTFGVVADERSTEVVLASGAVELASRLDPAQAVRLEPGQRSRVLGAEAPSAPERTDVAASLAWTGTWYFLSTPLEEVAQRFSAHYGVPVEVAPELRQLRYGGATSASAPVGEAMQLLEAALGVRAEREGAGYRIVPGPASDLE